MEDLRAVRRKDLGIAGSIIIIAEAVSNFRSTTFVQREIMKLRDDLYTLQQDHTRTFAQKSDLVPMSEKIDSLDRKLIGLDKKITALREVISEEGYESMNYTTEIVGCSYKKLTQETNYAL